MRKKSTSRISSSSRKHRLILFFVPFVIYVSVLSGRLFDLQVLQHEELLAKSEKQYSETVTVDYGRGTIFDRNHIALTQNIEVESISASLAEIVDRKKTARILASTLKINRHEVYRKLLSKKDSVVIKRKCTLKEARKIRRLQLPGIHFSPEQKRYYPKRQLAASVLGFVGLDNQGLAGLEHYHQSYLKGITVRQVVEKDGRKRFLRPVYDVAGFTNRSHDIVTTLDEVIQFITESHLVRQVEKYKAKGGMAIVMDPYSGRIMAWALAPRFNANNYASYSDQRWENSLVTGSFEPGSIFKPILASAALDSGRVKPEQVFFCENGKFRVGGVDIGEADNHSFGMLTLRDIITKSSNIGAIKVAYELGGQNYYDYIKRFGFGKKTGIDLSGEATGKLWDISGWSSLSLASLSFGQEIGVTPIQMVSAFAAIANGGKLMRPRITKAILKNGKPVKQFEPEMIRRVISEKTSRQMIGILKSAVKSGTGKRAALPLWSVAGKTGTAQIFDLESKSYSKTAFLSSFIGFAPADEPKLVALVMIDQPQGSYWGGRVAAPVFREIARETLRYLNVPSSKERVYFLDRA